MSAPTPDAIRQVAEQLRCLQRYISEHGLRSDLQAQVLDVAIQYLDDYAALRERWDQLAAWIATEIASPGLYADERLALRRVQKQMQAK